jgi:hypothetical protein
MSRGFWVCFLIANVQLAGFMRAGAPGCESLRRYLDASVDSAECRATRLSATLAFRSDDIGIDRMSRGFQSSLIC